MTSRRRLLHTCGLSTIQIALKASAAAQDLNGPLGSMVKRVVKMSSFATPFVHALLSLWLVLLSFADDHILAVGDIVEKFFPPSKHVLNKVDDLIRVVETLPEKFDYAVKSFPILIQQVPFLNWALVHVISLLEIIVAILTYWGLEGMKEKEIMIDINYNNREDKFELVTEDEVLESKLGICVVDQPTKVLVNKVESEDTNVDFNLVFETPKAKIDTANCVGVKQDGIKSTYKEVLEKGTNDVGSDQIVNHEATREGIEKTQTKKMRSPKGDLITELFELGWVKK